MGDHSLLFMELHKQVAVKWVLGVLVLRNTNHGSLEANFINLKSDYFTY